METKSEEQQQFPDLGTADGNIDHAPNARPTAAAAAAAPSLRNDDRSKNLAHAVGSGEAPGDGDAVVVAAAVDPTSGAADATTPVATARVPLTSYERVAAAAAIDPSSVDDHVMAAVAAATASAAHNHRSPAPPSPTRPPVPPVPPAPTPVAPLDDPRPDDNDDDDNGTLVATLRKRRRELDVAEAADDRASRRVKAAREAYDACVGLLAGRSVPPRFQRSKTIGLSAAARRDSEGIDAANAVVPSAAALRAAASAKGAAAAADDGAPLYPVLKGPPGPPRTKGQVKPEGTDVVLPTNDIYLPQRFVSGGGMVESTVSVHRDAFYLRLTKDQADASTIDDWIPPPNNANLKSRSQLREWIHIARHWNTGVDGLDAGAFRAKHKTWYSRMKPVTYNLGRRTGIHLRTLDAQEGEDEGTTVLCRYNKAGNKSIVYLEVGMLFDALFQIHSLELHHRGRDATKNLADERYANVPDGTVRAFLETCPICNVRRGGGLHI